MKVIDAVRRSGIGIEAERTIREAAEIMERDAVGALVVLDGKRPVGVVTDRDLVRRAVARGVSTDERIDSVMSLPVTTIDADADLRDAFTLLRSHGLRRLVVVRNGDFMAMVTVDDLLIDLAGDLADLVRPVTGEAIFGQREAATPATT